MRHAEETHDSKKACAVRNREAGLDRASLGSGYRAYGNDEVLVEVLDQIP